MTGAEPRAASKYISNIAARSISDSTGTVQQKQQCASLMLQCGLPLRQCVEYAHQAPEGSFLSSNAFQMAKQTHVPPLIPLVSVTWRQQRCKTPRLIRSSRILACRHKSARHFGQRDFKTKTPAHPIGDRLHKGLGRAENRHTHREICGANMQQRGGRCFTFCGQIDALPISQRTTFDFP